MFRLLFDLWRSTQSMKEMMHQFVEMLEMDLRMFVLVLDVLKAKTQRVDVHPDVYKRDVEINRRERHIRKEIVEHLSLHPGGDIPACLVLMSVVKDAERVGDYSKNLLEVAQAMHKKFEQLRHHEEIVEIAHHVIEIFENTIAAFKDSDTDLARDVVLDEGAMTRRCDALIEQIANSDLSANEAVCTAMIIRFLKRIEAHLSNIASSVVLPVHRMDGRLTYKNKKKKRQEAKKRAEALSGKTAEAPAEKPQETSPEEKDPKKEKARDEA
jgi:phosphate uptake regulator